MARKILEAVALADGTIFVAGDEKKLVAAGLSPADLKRLEDLDVISGFSRRGATDEETDLSEEDEDSRDVPVKELKAFLSKIDDGVAVQAMLEADDRPTARQHYQNRLLELSKKDEG